MTFVQASSTPSTISVRCFSEKGWRDRNLRTKLRINARFAVWLVNSSFPLFIGPNKRRAQLGTHSSCNGKLCWIDIVKRTWIEQSLVRLRTDSSCGERDVKNWAAKPHQLASPAERPIHLATS